MTTTTLSLQLMDAADLPHALRWLGGHFAEAGAPEAAAADLKEVLGCVAVDIFHAGKVRHQTVHLYLELELDPGRVRLRFTDDGRPFDPLSEAYPEHGAKRSNTLVRTGSPLVRQLTDEQHYRRTQEHNVLELIRYFDPLPGP
ncbi:ATP-binding protein [Marinobacter sp. NFXS9]|uniref:ATP-binding protein n=1 Tax=Marinobacter sp. NFXS9 TaxID=2818433 RepID=UPI0032DFBC8C